MTFISADRVRESSTSVGSGTVVLNGAVVGFRSFASVLADGDTCDYCIGGNSEWEVGTGTWRTGNLLERTTVLSSSNAGAFVDFAPSTKDVFLTQTAYRSNPVTIVNDAAAIVALNTRYAPHGLGVPNRHGFYFGSSKGSSNANTFSLNAPLLRPLVIDEPLTIDRIGIEITTGVPLAFPRLGIFTIAGATITTVLDSGPIDATTTGFKEVVISQALSAGLYWVGFVSQGAAAVGRNVLTPMESNIGHVSGLVRSQNMLPSIAGAVQTGPFPATFAVSSSSTFGPEVLVRVL